MPENGSRILVIDDNQILLETISTLLGTEGFDHDITTSPVEGLRLVKEKDYDLVISDMRMPEMTGLELLKMVKLYRPKIEVILITGFGSINSAVRAMKLGAYHYLTKPFNHEELIIIVKRALHTRELEKRYEYLKQQFEEKYSFDNIIGNCAEMKKIFGLIKKVAPTTAPILIQGESGTGKELIARAIHQNSKRKNEKFLAINTTSLPETLLESELFGYKKGAFTGADRDKIGLLEDTRGGTLFLDEVGSMSKHFQGKLLRAIQESEIIPVGSSKPVSIDVRFISASNKNLKELVGAGLFREDLYYRLNVIEIFIPPLRERMDDILLLADYFLHRFCEEHNMSMKSFSKEAMKHIFSHDWPGNVRELENVIRRAVIVSDGKLISPNDIIIKKLDKGKIPGAKDLYSMKYEEAKQTIYDSFQQQYFSRVLQECKGNISKAAQYSGLTRQALYKIMKRHNIRS